MSKEDIPSFTPKEVMEALRLAADIKEVFEKLPSLTHAQYLKARLAIESGMRSGPGMSEADIACALRAFDSQYFQTPPTRTN